VTIAERLLGEELVRNYWYCWWGGASLAVAATAVIPRVGMGLAAASIIMVASVVLWLVLLALGIYLARPMILKRFSFYWSLAVLVASVLVLYWTLALAATGAAGKLDLTPNPAQPTVDVTDLAVDAFVGHVVWLATLLAVFVLGGWVVTSLWVGRVAADRGRNKVAWFWIAMILPLISWVIVASMTPVRPLVAAWDQDTGPIPTLRGRTRKCPMCAEDILVEAKKCKHCGEYLSA
jgi:hypothetical protein